LAFNPLLSGCWKSEPPDVWCYENGFLESAVRPRAAPPKTLEFIDQARKINVALPTEHFPDAPVLLMNDTIE
jgi:hypothetical protein